MGAEIVATTAADGTETSVPAAFSVGARVALVTFSQQSGERISVMQSRAPAGSERDSQQQVATTRFIIVQKNRA
jgi:hypothetical protein